MSRRTWRTLGGAAGLSTLLVVTWGPAGPAWADGHGGHPHASSGHESESSGQGGNAPAGNNGTVKINDEATPNQDNDPHVGCNFSVSFYGYDSGSQSGQLTFAGQSPTRGSGSVTLSASWTTAERTGGDQLDQTVPVSFSQLAGLFKGVAPAHQGYHVKLTATVSGSQGSDVKHKVFWIDCSPAPAASPGGPASSGPASSGAASAGSSSGAPSSGSPAGTPPNGPTAVGGTGTEAGAPPGASGGTQSSAGIGAPSTISAPGLGTPLTAVEGLTLAAPATAAGAQPPGTVMAAAAGPAIPAAPGNGSTALPPARAGGAVAGSTLAFTGFRALGIAGLGSGLVAGGSALAILGRRRRRG